VSALDQPARQLLFLVAVAGWPLALELVVAMAALPARELDAAIARLRQAHLVRLGDGPGKGALEPYHDRVREAVLDHLDEEKRKQCHRALAEALLEMGAVDRVHEALPLEGTPAARGAHEPPNSSNASRDAEAIAVHLHGAGELAQAAHYLAMAADKAAAAFAFDHAARLYRQALELHAQAGEPPDVFGPGGARDVLTRLARTLAHASRGAEAAAVYLQLARMAEAIGEEDIQLRLRAAEQFLHSGYVQEGKRVLDPVLDQLGMGRAATRLGVLWRFLWRRIWLRMRGFGYHERTSAEMTARELLRMDACREASTSAEDVSPDFMVRYQLMALRAGEPLGVGLALFVEIYYQFIKGAAATPHSARIIEQLSGLAQRTGEPYLLGLASAARSLRAVAQGEWLHGREHGAQAIQIFHEHCPDSARECLVALLGYLGGMALMGDLRDFVRELPPLIRDAQERHDRLTFTQLHASYVGFLWLIQDQPETAQRQMPESTTLGKLNKPASRLMDMQVCSTYARIALYRGDGATAYRCIDQGMHQNLSPPSSRGFLLSCHGLAALAACRSGDFDRRKLVREVARDARSLRALRAAWADAYALAFDAGVAIVIGDPSRARDLLERAHAEFKALGMMLHAMLARRRLGELAGGADGQEAIAEADAWLGAQGVVSPERLARVFMPDVA
jgi:hypothetical protein